MTLRRFITCLLLLPLSASSSNGQDLFGVNDAASDDAAPTTQSSSTSSTRLARPSRITRRNPPNVVDLLTHVDTADTWSDGTLHNANVIADHPARVALGYRQRSFPRTGTWTSPEVRTKFDFTDLIASFNPHCPPDTGATLEVRVRQGETWSPWLFLQSWGRVIFPPQRTTKFEGGEVDIDELILSQPAQAYQLRVGLISFGFNVEVAPSVRRASVCYSGVVDDAEQRKRHAPPPTTLPSNWARDLPVPFRGQGAYENPRSLWGLICSPTSTSMVMEFHGVNCTTLENARAIYDPQYDLFGNWGRAVSRAGEMGLDAWLARFRNWDEVKAEVAAGNPVIASIRFRKGQVNGFLYESTGGHLIVIRGFTPEGDVIVNDPASREKGNGPVYLAAEFAKAWFDNGGVGYVIRRPERPIPTSLIATAPPQSPPTTAPTTAPAKASAGR